MKAIVCGVIATWPVGGVAWDYLQYVAALQALGFEVTYLEDTGLSAYDSEDRTYTTDLSSGVQYLERALHELVPAVAATGRWHVRDADGRTWGLRSEDLRTAVSDADLFLNVSGMCLLRDEYLANRCKVFIDTDPGWNHFVVFPRQDSGRLWPGTASFRGHDHFFTYAARAGRSDFSLPDFGLRWHPTRPLAVLDAWPRTPPGDQWTTVLTWDNYTGAIEHTEGHVGSKGPELAKIESLPARTGAMLELAVGGVEPPVDRWRQCGWSVVDGPAVTRTPEDYARYIVGSRGELSVAKQVYVATRSGWFSDRSVCYLAAGRPAVLQDTGWTDWLEPGDGVLAFDTVDGAADALEAVESDFDRHAEAARKIAASYFSGDVVLGELLDKVGV